MAPSSRAKLLLLLIVHFFSNAVLANNDDVKSKLDALVQSLDRLSTVIDTKCKPCCKKQHLHFTYCYLYKCLCTEIAKIM